MPVVDPQIQEVLVTLQEMGFPDFSDVSVEEARKWLATLQPAPEQLPAIHSVMERTMPGPAGEIGIRVYRPSADPGLPVLVWFHGGGWTLGDLDTGQLACRNLANLVRAAVVSVDYRLAPENRFPAAADDCHAATAWVAEHGAELGVDGSRLAVGGDSAGGNLAAVVALRSRAEGPPVAFQLLIYPVIDADFSRPSYDENAEGWFLTKRSMIWFWDHYVPDAAARSHPWVAPIKAEELAGLPPAHVVTAELDPLRDEGEAYAAALEAAGVPVTFHRYPGVIHGFFGMSLAVDAGQAAQVEAAEHLGKALG
jgi:acetyl esterase